MSKIKENITHQDIGGKKFIIDKKNASIYNWRNSRLPT